MEIQPTPELKARFFAQYMNEESRILCEILQNNETIGPVPMSSFNLRQATTKGQQEGYFLLLKPLSSITDEDCEVLLPIVISTSYRHVHTTPRMVKAIFKDYLDNPSTITGNQWWAICDILRSRGYAVPFMGISVETLIEWGWAKLIETKSV